MNVTRRKLAGAVFVSAAAQAIARGQAPADAPRTPEDELRIARGRVQSASEVLAKQNIPMAIEPAFQFKA